MKRNLIYVWMCVAIMFCVQILTVFAQEMEVNELAINQEETFVETENKDEDESNVVFSQGELEEWLESPKSKEVFLGSNIEINEYANLYCNDEVTINTGEYGFIVYSNMSVVGAVTIVGNGDLTPVIKVCDGGSLNLQSQSTPIEIIATEENGCALSIDNGGAYQAESSSWQRFVTEGANGIGINAEMPIDLYHHEIQASGRDGKAIVSTEPVSLRLCNIKAVGASVEAPQVLIDSCHVSPSVLNAQSITRKLSNLKMQFSQGKFFNINEIDGIFDYKYRCIATLSEEGENDIFETVYVKFDDTGISLDTPGEYVIPGEFVNVPLEVYDFIPPSEIQLKIITFDSLTPFFYSYSKNDGEYIFEYIYEGDSLNLLTLWRSDNNGQSWKRCWKEGQSISEYPKVNWDGSKLEVVFPEDDFITPAILVFEVKGCDQAYALLVDTEKGPLFSDANGGDRVGGDRFILPWDLTGDNTGSTSDDEGIETSAPAPSEQDKYYSAQGNTKESGELYFFSNTPTILNYTENSTYDTTDTPAATKEEAPFTEGKATDEALKVEETNHETSFSVLQPSDLLNESKENIVSDTDAASDPINTTNDTIPVNEKDALVNTKEIPTDNKSFPIIFVMAFAIGMTAIIISILLYRKRKIKQ